jgi:hypothetical protein
MGEIKGKKGALGININVSQQAENITFGVDWGGG